MVPGRRLLGILVVLPALLAVAPLPVLAQTELQSLIGPTLGEQMGRASYRYTLYPSEGVQRQSSELELKQHNLTFSFPLWQNPRDEWSLSGRVRLQDYETRAVLPDSGERFPGELWYVSLGAGYRHRFDNNWIGGGSLTIASASDEPFASEDELIVRALGFLRIPHRERNAWFLSLIYGSDIEDFGGFPIPGLAYHWIPSERFQAVIGFPFSSVEYKPVEPITLELQYFPIRRVRARATYRPFRPFRVYLGFDWDNEFHFRADRGDKDDKLYYYEKRLTGGARFDLRHVGVDVAAGWAFDRFYFEGESYSDRRDNRIDVNDGPFVAVGVSVRF